jgi:hypothetical protein
VRLHTHYTSAAQFVLSAARSSYSFSSTTCIPVPHKTHAAHIWRTRAHTAVLSPACVVCDGALPLAGAVLLRLARFPFLERAAVPAFERCGSLSSAAVFRARTESLYTTIMLHRSPSVCVNCGHHLHMPAPCDDHPCVAISFVRPSPPCDHQLLATTSAPCDHQLLATISSLRPLSHARGTSTFVITSSTSQNLCKAHVS